MSFRHELASVTKSAQALFVTPLYKRPFDEKSYRTYRQDLSPHYVAPRLRVDDKPLGD